MLHYKKYDSYEEYLKDQTEKIRLRESYIRKKSKRKVDEFRVGFTKYELPKYMSVLCLGARFGEEVLAWQCLGHAAIGIDLFGNEPELVLKGDWNDMLFVDDATFDCVFTNSIDHASDIQRMIGEIKRVLVPDGKVILELMRKHASNNEMIKKKFDNPERYESMLWNDDRDVLDAFEGFKVSRQWRDRRTEPFHCYLLERLC